MLLNIFHKNFENINFVKANMCERFERFGCTLLLMRNFNISVNEQYISCGHECVLMKHFEEQILIKKILLQHFYSY